MAFVINHDGSLVNTANIEVLDIGKAICHMSSGQVVKVCSNSELDIWLANRIKIAKEE